MTATQIKDARKKALRSLVVGDTVRVVLIGQDYAGPGTGVTLATATVVKVLANAVRVAWVEAGTRGTTTDFSRDTGKPVGEKRWIGYPMIDVTDAPTVGPAY